MCCRKKEVVEGVKVQGRGRAYEDASQERRASLITRRVTLGGVGTTLFFRTLLALSHRSPYGNSSSDERYTATRITSGIHWRPGLTGFQQAAHVEFNDFAPQWYPHVRRIDFH